MHVGKLSTWKPRLQTIYTSHLSFSAAAAANSLNECGIPQDIESPPISDSIFTDAGKLGSYTRGDSTFYSLIQHHAQSGDFRALEMIFQRMKRDNRAFPEKLFILAFRAYGKARLHRKAIQLFDTVMEEEYGCAPTVKSFNSVLNVIIQQGLYRDALDFYHYVVNRRIRKRISPNSLTFNLVIKSLCRLGLVGRALDVFREMPNFNCKPDTYTYCTLMDGLCKEDRIDDAVALLDEMQIEGCYPTPPTFNVLINGLCRKGDLTRASNLIDNMFLKGCVPNEVTYNTLIHGLCLKGKLHKAVDLLGRMLSNSLKPNEVTYGTIINGFVKKRRAVDGLDTLLAMEQRGFEANEYSYSAIISGLFREGESDKALNFWSDMIQKGRKPNTVVYTAVIDGLCREGKPHEAEEFFSQMIDVGLSPNAHTYSSLMKGFFQVGDCDKAVRLWKEVVEKDYIDNQVCYTVLIHGFCKNGKLKDALVVWKHVLAKGLTPDVVAYSSMIHGFCNDGLVEQGLSLFNEMLYKTSESKPDVITYNIIINALCRQGSISHALDILNCMLNQGCDPDSVTCKIFLTAFREKLDLSVDAREFLDELVLRLGKRNRIYGASNIIHVMLQNFLQPKASTWDKALKGCFDVREDDNGAGSPYSRDFVLLDSNQRSKHQPLTSGIDQEFGRDYARDSCHSGSLSTFVGSELQKVPSNSVLRYNNLSAGRFIGNGDREHMQPRYSGPLQGRQRKDFNNSTPGEDAADRAVVERRGRFKVTSADVNPKDSINHSNSASGISTIASMSSASVLPSLQCLLHLNAMEREAVLKMVEFVEQASGNARASAGTGMTDLSQIIPTSVKELELQTQVIQMQQSIGSLVEELHKVKAKNSRMERKLSVKLKNHDAIREQLEQEMDKEEHQL